MMLKLDVMPDPQPILAEAQGWSLEFELSCNMPLSVLERLVKRERPTPYQALLRRGDRAVGLAVRTSEAVFLAVDPAASADGSVEQLAELLAEDFDHRFDELPELFGPKSLVDPLASLLAARRGVEVKPTGANFFYGLHEPVAPARPASGRARKAVEHDHGLVTRWIEAFVRDADLPPLEDAAGRASFFIDLGDMWLWLDERNGDEEVVSMAAIGGRTRRGARIGFVYTPPEARGRGYAAAITDVTTRYGLEDCETCCLFADVNNPLTNRLYQRLGYRRSQEFADVAFS